MEIANAYLHRGSYPPAMAELGEAARNDSMKGYPHEAIGKILFDLGRIDEAVAMLSKSVELDPGFAPAHISLGRALMARGEFDLALSSWTAGFEPYALMLQLQAAGIPAGVCQTAGDPCDNDPQLRHLGWLTELTGTRIGRWPLAEIPVRMSRTPPYLGGRPDRAAPQYGEDNTAILTGLLGMSEEEVAELTEQGVL